MSETERRNQQSADLANKLSRCLGLVLGYSLRKAGHLGVDWTGDLGELLGEHACACVCLTRRLIWSVAIFVVGLTMLTEARPQNQRDLQHIAVVENAAWEQTLPQQFQNPFYKTPRVRDALARSSWFGPGEEVVYDRQAEKIPRMEIYNVLSHAGLIPRRRFF
ncbi:Hypothetical predicted protein [Drosophila guanche]|uniref:Uncharacterized protein n=2 Tax=Drosophila guanche TaxID=7266 RepID=A0A3B0K934_DROGU|nr:Hypothetical predicted protein [Drosophila guanche]